MQLKITSVGVGGGSGAANMVEFWTLEGYAVGFLVYVVVVRSILGGNERSGSVLSGG